MGLGILFNPKRSGPKRRNKSLERDKKNDATSLKLETDQSPKSYDSNIVYPFYDEKMTSFPPPLSIDASVLTEPQKSTVITSQENKIFEKRVSRENDKVKKNNQKVDEEKKKDEIKENKQEGGRLRHLEEDICDYKSCAHENRGLEICNTSGKKQGLEEKISRTKLTEMINSSIKEAMQTIVKQCRMDEEKILSSKEPEKKPKEESEKSVCYTKDEPAVKSRYEHRPRSTQEQCNNRSRASRTHNNGHKSNRFAVPEKCNTVRPRSKKLHEEVNPKNHIKKENVCEVAREKKQPKSGNNVKTDNRRMTGNVNIYICSEATDNTQGTGKQGTKSATSTEASSSNKLVTNVRKKRRKPQEQDSLESYPEREEIGSNSSDTSNVCSCITGYTDSNVTSKLGSNDVSTADLGIEKTESSSLENDCCCKDVSGSDLTIDGSDLSFQRTYQRPCTTIYPSKIKADSVDSEDWLSKSTCSNLDRGHFYECVRSDQHYGKDDKRRHGNVWRTCVKPERDWLTTSICKNDRGHFYADSLNSICGDVKDRKSAGIACKYRNEDREVNCGDWKGQNHRKCKKHSSENLQKGEQRWSTCSCIAEEEEEDYCMNRGDAEESAQELTICRNLDDNVNVVDCKAFPEDSKKLPENLSESVCVFQKSMDNMENGIPQNDTKTAPVTKNKIDQTNDENEKTKIHKDENTKNEKVIENETKIKERQRAENLSKNQPTPENPARNPKLTKIEMRLLKNNPKTRTKLQPLAKPAGRGGAPPNPHKKSEIIEQKTPEKNITDVRKPIKPTLVTSRRPMVEKDNRTVEEETGKETDDKKDSKQGAEKTVKARVKDSILCRALKKVLGTIKHRGPRPEEHTDQDNTKAESPANSGENKKNEDAKSKIEKHKSPIRAKEKIISQTPTGSGAEKETKDKAETAKNIPKAKDTDGNKKTDNEAPRFGQEKKIENPTKDDKPKTTYDATKEKRSKPKLLAVIATRKASFLASQKDGAREPTEQLKPQDIPKKPEPLKDAGGLEKPKTPEIKKGPHDQRPLVTEIPEPHEGRTLAKVDDKKYSIPDSKDEAPTVCVQCVKQELPKKESKKSIASQYVDHEPNHRTVCTTPKFTRCNDIDEELNTIEKNKEDGCAFYQPPISQCYNEPPNYPRSCLKKERKVCNVDPTPNDPSICFNRYRNWEECGCRKPGITCNDCCESQNEYSCGQLPSCVDCCNPRDDCSCKPYVYLDPCRCRKSMFCVYCDNPRERCNCRVPVRNCSCCELSLDLCTCQDQEVFYNGRPVLAETDNDRTMYVTAWKPRKEVRRYFSRDPEDLRADSNDDCRCLEKLKTHGSNDLPYQRLRVFSDVMNELQRKISESVCCTQCRKVPCACSVKAERGEEREKRRARYCASPTAGRKAGNSGNGRSRSNSPANDRQRTVIITRVCCACKSSPCRCKRSKSSQKKPRAKCYYCKSSPCVCITGRERGKPRPCRCADSPCRTKEKEITPRGKVSANRKNNEENAICVR